jgi:hypothetical protein
MRSMCMFLMLGALLNGSYVTAAIPAPKECCDCAEDMIKRGAQVEEAKCGCNKPNEEAVASNNFSNAVARIVAHYINNKTANPDKEVSLVITAIIKNCLNKAKIPPHVHKQILNDAAKELAGKLP